MIQKLIPALGRMAEACRFFVYLLTWDAEKAKYAKRPDRPIATASMTFRDAYAEAMRVRASGQHATVGMRIDDGLFFVDVDKLPGDYTLDDRAREVLAMFPGCFTEWSSGKRGLHIVGRLAAPIAHGCKNTAHQLELYTRDRGIALNVDAQPSGSMGTVADVSQLVARYFPPPPPLPLAEPSASNGMSDDGLIAKALAARSSAASVFGGRASFAQLWRGEADKNSENDAALACHLAYWTGRDPERVMRLMLASGMVREKWSKHRTYLSKTIANACAHCTEVYEPIKKMPPPPSLDATPRVRNAADLMRREFQPVQWAVRDILPEGVTILSGDPKIGKSWLVYQMCVAIAGGAPLWAGRAPEISGDALYLDLEGNDRRLQRRLEKLLPAFGSGLDTTRLHYATDWPRAEVGVAELATWLRDHPACRIVVIDTVSAFRDNDPGRKSAYAHDYAVGELLKPLAREFSCAIVLVMHNRKQAAGDVMQRVSGTQGMTGSVDNVLVLERTRGDLDAALSIDGRDIEHPAQLALRFNGGPWCYVGNVTDVQRSKERTAVMEAITAQRGAATLGEICDAIPEKKRGTIKTMLSKMVKAGELRNDEGIYTLAHGFVPKLPPPPSLQA